MFSEKSTVIVSVDRLYIVGFPQGSILGPLFGTSINM